MPADKMRLLTIFAVDCLSIFFLSSSVQAVAPTEQKMLMLSATGQRWGGTEDSFTLHAMSLKSSRGNALWNDADPDYVTLINPENKLYFKQTLDEYVSDVFKSGPRRGLTKTACKNIKLSDGTSAVETVLSVTRSHMVKPWLRIVSIPSVSLPPEMARTWCYIMGCPEERAFIISLEKASKKDTNPDGSPIWHKLVQYNSFKVLPIEAARFTIPRQYKRAADKAAFFFSDEGSVLKSKDLDDLFRSQTK